MVYQEYVEKLKQSLTPERFKHSVGVSDTAVKLAERYRADVNKAKIAGLLHDCARNLPKDMLYLLAQKYALDLNEVERNVPALLHAPIGAKLAKYEYGITDQEILKAIELHTIGGRELTDLEAIIYIADYIEPNRTFSSVNRLRQLADKNLNEALLACYTDSIRHCLSINSLIHPATIEGRNALIIKLSSK